MVRIHGRDIRILLYEQDLYFPYVIGVSAGACHAASYLPDKEIEIKRSILIMHHIRNIYRIKTYGENVSYLIWIFIFHEIPEKHVPFDFETYFNSSGTFPL